MNQQTQQGQQGQPAQNPGTIKNPSTGVPVVKSPDLNDRDMLNDVLATEKYLTDNFNIFAREASHDQLHRTVMGVLTESHQAARETYKLMFRKGWYELTSAPQHTLQQTKQQFSNYSTQFPYGGGQ